MRLIIDENVRREVTDFLGEERYDLLILPSGTDDATIARTARESKRIILTHDRHFADILTYPPSQYAGIIRVRINPPTADAVIHSLKELFKRLSPEDFAKRLIVLEKDGFRIR
jgi:predicted nuclease of predicted toxin-antitoxin system